MKKSILRCIKWLLILIVGLPLICAALIYVPPIQNYVAHKMTEAASLATGLRIKVDRVNLGFPLRLVVRGTTAADSSGVELLSVEKMKLRVRLIPLINEKIEIDLAEINGARVDSRNLIEGFCIKGSLENARLESHGVAFNPGVAVIDNFEMSNADLRFAIRDTAATDSSTTAGLPWKFKLGRAKLKNVLLEAELPDDSMDVRLDIGSAEAVEGTADLKHGRYLLQKFVVAKTSAGYKTMTATERKSEEGVFNPDDILLKDIEIELDSVKADITGSHFKTILTRLEAEERSGLRITSARARLEADSTTIKIPSCRLITSESDIALMGSADLRALSPGAGGNINLTLRAAAGKPDVMRLAGKLPEHYPSEPARVLAGISGNVDMLRLETFDASLPRVFHLRGKGYARRLMSKKRREAEITLDTDLGRMDIVNRLTGGFNPPSGGRLALKGRYKSERAGVELKLYERNAILSHADSIMDVEKRFTAPGVAALRAEYDFRDNNYAVDFEADNLDMYEYMPGDSLNSLSARLTLKGHGTDFDLNSTKIKLEAEVAELGFDNYSIRNIKAAGTYSERKVEAALSSDNDYLRMKAAVTGSNSPGKMKLAAKAEIAKADWQALRLTATPLTSSHNIAFSAEYDGKKQFAADIKISDNRLKDKKGHHKFKDISAGASSSIMLTTAYLRSGDLDISATATGGIKQLDKTIVRLMDKLERDVKEKRLDEWALREYLPMISLNIRSGHDNPLQNTLAMSGLRYDALNFRLNLSPEDGVSGRGLLRGLHTDSMRLDSIFYNVSQDTTGIKSGIGIHTGRKEYQDAFKLEFNLGLEKNKARLTTSYKNGEGRTGVYIGLAAALTGEGVALNFFPSHPTLVYRKFTVNDDNYIKIKDNGRILSKVMIADSTGMGASLYSSNEDSTMTKDVSLELNRIDLEEFRRVIPYMPSMKGLISVAAHYMESELSGTMISTDLNLEDFIYKGYSLGSYEAGAVYLPGKGAHHVDGFLNHDENEILAYNGLYSEREEDIEADVQINNLPLHIINPFIPSGTVELTGNIDGDMKAAGKIDMPQMDGTIKLDSVTMFMPDISARFKFDDEPVSIKKSRALFKGFDIYTDGRQPFTIDGYADFSNPSRTTLDLEMKADNYEVINAPKTRRAMTYGKMYADVDATLSGPLDELTMNGEMHILGSTSLTYVMRDSPVSVQDRLGELVEFTDFEAVETSPWEDVDAPRVALRGMDIAMTMHIDPAARARINMDENGDNYLLLEGGGDLSFQYTPRGEMILNGKYSLLGGEMKYDIPVIPLKTFYVKSGSSLEWSGDVMNPELKITATERNRARVSSADGSARIVNFDVGVKIDKTLASPGVEFILEAPDDAAVQTDLTAMSSDERARLAVTMLITGSYLAEGNDSGRGFNMDNAVNSFLQSRISDIVGKTIDIDVGMDVVDDESGRRTDYSFQFSKRFWNNRINIVIGGRVSTGNKTRGQNESFIDNISIAYRLDESGTKFIRLFHDRTFESVLEGEVEETGLGIMFHKKMDKLGELFIFKKKKKK